MILNYATIAVADAVVFRAGILIKFLCLFHLVLHQHISKTLNLICYASGFQYSDYRLNDITAKPLIGC